MESSIFFKRKKREEKINGVNEGIVVFKSKRGRVVGGGGGVQVDGIHTMRMRKFPIAFKNLPDQVKNLRRTV